VHKAFALFCCNLLVGSVIAGRSDSFESLLESFVAEVSIKPHSSLRKCFATPGASPDFGELTAACIALVSRDRAKNYPLTNATHASSNLERTLQLLCYDSR
jgi:hypothetical protein